MRAAAEALGQTVIDIGAQDVSPVYVAPGANQIMDLPGLVLPAGESADLAQMNLWMEFQAALGNVGYDLGVEAPGTRAIKKIPVAWSQDATNVIIGDENLGPRGYNGHVTRETVSISLPGITMKQLVILSSVMTRYFPKMKMLIICAGTHDWLNRVNAPQPIQEAELQAVIEVTVDGMISQVECAPAVPTISIVVVAPPRTLPHRRSMRITEFSEYVEELLRMREEAGQAKCANGIHLISVPGMFSTPHNQDQEFLVPSQIPEYLTRIEIWIRRCLSPGTTLLLSINSGPTLRHIMYMAYEEAQEEEDDLGRNRLQRT